MVRTPDDALHLLETTNVLTEVPAAGVPSLVEAVAGGPVQGSWREHRRGNLIYRLGRRLRAAPDVLAVKLVEGKITFLARPLWPLVYRVVMDSVRRRSALAGLSAEARSLLSRVERDGSVRTDAIEVSEKARLALEERLLVHVSEIDLEGDGHALLLQSWRRWASEGLKEMAAQYDYDDALARLREACGGAPGGFGPWVLPGH